MKMRNVCIFILSLLLAFLIILLLIFDNIFIIDDFKVLVTRIFDKKYYNFFLSITNIMSVTGLVFLTILMIYMLSKKGKTYALKNFICTCFLGISFVSLLKVIIHRARPDLGLLLVDGYSFPSGHAYTSTVVYGFFILIIHRYYKNRRYRYFLYLLFFGLIVLTCVSRIYFNVHYVSDVIAGFLFGVSTLIVSNHYLKKRNEIIC